MIMEIAGVDVGLIRLSLGMASEEETVNIDLSYVSASTQDTAVTVSGTEEFGK